jgi:hypothetical protein
MKTIIVTPKSMKRGMVVAPFWGESTYNKSLDSLDWEQTLRREWWTHVVIGTSPTEVRLARPYAYAHTDFDANSPLLGCEVYSVPVESTHPYILLRTEFTT